MVNNLVARIGFAQLGNIRVQSYNDLHVRAPIVVSSQKFQEVFMEVFCRLPTSRGTTFNITITELETISMDAEMRCNINSPC